ncbi:MAG TPA: protease pro-enzyme activation domain-containing protein, partial [Tepidisphaeraceae bacterium]|nr:protease pro-enzyme activation domain-containing protein [Tepidisphaeraceae bacterium]
MRKDLLAIGLGMVLSCITVFSSSAQNAVRLHGHVPAAVVRGQARALSRVDDEKTVDLSIGLPLRNRTSLTNLLNQIYDPKSANYGKYLTPQQFTEHFAPTEKDYQEVMEFARKNHLKVTRTHANRMLVDVSGRAADVESAFGVTLNRYQHPTEAREFFAPDREPSVPAGVQIQDIGGLDDYRRPHPHYHLKPGTTPVPLETMLPKAKANAANPNATTGSGPGGDYIGDDFRRAYVPGTTLDGSGQTVALVQFDGYFASDIA